MFTEYTPGPTRQLPWDTTAPPPPSSRGVEDWRGRDVVYALLLAAIGFLAIGVGIAAVAAAGNLEGDRLTAAVVIASAVFELMLAGIALGLARKRGLSLGAVGLRRPRRWGPLIVGWIGAYVALFAYTAVLVLIEETGVDLGAFEGTNDLPITPSERTWLVVLLGVSVVAVAPLAEELFFRSLIFRGLRAAWGYVPALLVAGLLFGAFHLNLAVFIPFSAIGIIFAWVNEQSGSLWTSIIAHAAFNGVSFFLAAAGAG